MIEEEDKECWQQLNKAYIESSSQFDKQVLYFASGALALSFTFIKDIVKLPVASCKHILIISWCFFVAVILLSIVSHYSSKKKLILKSKTYIQKMIQNLLITIIIQNG